MSYIDEFSLAVRALVRMRVCRLRNMMTAKAARSSKLAGAPRARDPKERLSGRRIILGLFTLVLLSVFAAAQTRVFLFEMFCGTHDVCQKHSGARLLNAYNAALVQQSGFNDTMLRGMTGLTTLTTILCLLVLLATTSSSKTGWDMEWLITLPISRPALYLSRIVDRTIAHAPVWVPLLAVMAVAGWYANFGNALMFVVVLVVVPLALNVGAVWGLVDLTLRAQLTPDRRRSVETVLSVGIPLFTMLVVRIGALSSMGLQAAVVRATPDWLTWMPPGVAIRLLTAPSTHVAILNYGLLLAETGICLTLSFQLMHYQTRRGFDFSGVRESGRARIPTIWAGSAQITGTAQARFQSRRISPVIKRELISLARDRRKLVPLLLPVILVVARVLSDGHNALAMLTTPTRAANAAFILGAVPIWATISLALSSEGDSLWMLYTFPFKLADVLRKKAFFYGLICLAYPVAVYLYTIATSHQTATTYIPEIVLVFVGLTFVAHLALSVAMQVPVRLFPGQKPRQADDKSRYLFFPLAIIGYPLFILNSPPTWSTACLLMLLIVLAITLRQRAIEKLPYLLDLTASSPPHIALSDGVTALTLFAVLQFAFLFAIPALAPPELHMPLGYAATCIITYALTRLALHRTPKLGMPRFLGPANTKSALHGIAAGIIAVCINYIYLKIGHSVGYWNPQKHGHASVLDFVVLCLAWVAVGPPVEEFLFRGMLFEGFRRQFGATLSITLSSALFAICHPTVSMFPVFIIGILTASLRERHKTLLPGLICHALVNAGGIFFALVGTS